MSYLRSMKLPRIKPRRVTLPKSFLILATVAATKPETLAKRLLTRISREYLSELVSQPALVSPPTFRVLGAPQ